MNINIQKIINEYKRQGSSLTDIKRDFLSYIELNCEHENLTVKIQSSHIPLYLDLRISCDCCTKTEYIKLKETNDLSNFKSNIFYNSKDNIQLKIYNELFKSDQTSMFLNKNDEEYKILNSFSFGKKLPWYKK